MTNFPSDFDACRNCIHKFSSSNLLIGSSSTAPTAITSIAQSPAIDVLAVGFASGEISVYDIRADERLMRIFMREGSVRAISFRSGTFGFFGVTSSQIHPAHHSCSPKMDNPSSLLHRKPATYPCGISVPMDGCYTLSVAHMIAGSQLWNGCQDNLC